MQILSKLLPPNIETIHLVGTTGEDFAPVLMNIEEVLLQNTERLKYLRYTVMENQFLTYEELLTSRELPSAYNSQDAVFELHMSAHAIDVEFRTMLSEPACKEEDSNVKLPQIPTGLTKSRTWFCA